MGRVVSEESTGVVHPVGVSGVVLPEPKDEIQILSALLDKEKPLFKIFETCRSGERQWF